MCGIAGAIWTDPELAVSDALLRRMTDMLSHRGPDDAGYFQSDYQTREPYEAQPGVALGHRRLSIIDLTGGHQPLANEDDSIWIVFNGEIYNYPALRHRLEGSGHKFRTDSDTETIVHLYEDEGLDCFEHLNGMFALAIYDARRRRLVLARDRLGKKPLVYQQVAGRLLFASELKSLLAVPGVARDLDPAAIDEYLTYQYIPHPNTIFRGIKKLPPGHYAAFQDGRLEVKSYWQVDFATEQHWTEADAQARLKELLYDAVKLRLRSDVPLGAFLSGGIDSSIICALAQDALKEMSGERLKTFTIGFPVKEFDESGFAENVAKHLDTDHHTMQVQPNAVNILPKLVWHYDEPFADSSAIPTWYLSELTRQHVTVALSGDGGDELFAGYPRYRAVALASAFDRWPNVRNFMAAKFWQKLPSGQRDRTFRRRALRFSAAIGQTPQRRYLEWIAIFREAQRASLYTDDFIEQLPESDPLAFISSRWRGAANRDPVTAASLTDLTTYLPCDLMTKVDIASMAHGLETRCPLLDWRVVEFAASLPVALKYRWGQGKGLLRRAFANRLPQEVWKRPKMGFGVPLSHWFREDLRSMTREVLLSSDAKARGTFRPEAVEQLITEHESRNYDHSHRLWALLFLELWLKEWMSGSSVGVVGRASQPVSSE
jgi:asparagine synthase (glutamine-hydrolysing)